MILLRRLTLFLKDKWQIAALSLCAFLSAAVAFGVYMLLLKPIIHRWTYQIQIPQFFVLLALLIAAGALILVLKRKQLIRFQISPFKVHFLIYLIFVSGLYALDGVNSVKPERFEYMFEGPYQKIFDEQLGYRYTPDTFYRQATIRIADGHVDTIFDVTFRTDKHGRRIMPEDTSHKRAAIFFGCSYVYGMGVEDTQTIPYYYYLRDTSVNVYNYALDGYGPNNALRQLEITDVAKQVYGDSVIGFYVYLGDHVQRVVGAKSHFNMWTRDFPYYEVTEDSVIYQGRFIKAQPLRAFIYKLLAELTFIDKIFVYRNWTTRNDHYETARVLAEMEKKFLEQFPKGKFYLILHPYDPSRYDIMPYLKQQKISHILDARMFLDTMHTMMIPHEPHPAPQGHKFMVDYIYPQLQQ